MTIIKITITPRVLILDDMDCRHERFKKILHKCTLYHAFTIDEAISFIDKEEIPFDLVCLDHDLGDNPDIEPTSFAGMYGSKILTGQDFCHFMVQKYKKGNLIARKAIIHSHNPTGRIAMADILSVIPIKVKVLSFVP
jgi:hypothetical protein